MYYFLTIVEVVKRFMASLLVTGLSVVVGYFSIVFAGVWYVSKKYRAAVESGVVAPHLFERIDKWTNIIVNVIECALMILLALFILVPQTLCKPSIWLYYLIIGIVAFVWTFKIIFTFTRMVCKWDAVPAAETDTASTTTSATATSTSTVTTAAAAAAATAAAATTTATNATATNTATTHANASEIQTHFNQDSVEFDPHNMVCFGDQCMIIPPSKISFGKKCKIEELTDLHEMEELEEKEHLSVSDDQDDQEDESDHDDHDSGDENESASEKEESESDDGSDDAE
jgi:hypothetical protein